MELSNKQMKNIEIFITTSLFLADKLCLAPEEIISATLIMQKRLGKKIGHDLESLNNLILEFLKKDKS